MAAAELRIFEAVARLGSMGRAADERHTVQSNVTMRIRQLCLVETAFVRRREGYVSSGLAAFLAQVAAMPGSKDARAAAE